jgi:hypothetical protein
MNSYPDELWARYSPELAALLDVNLPPALHDQFKAFFDGLQLYEVPGVPDWVMDMYAVHDAMAGAHYHWRRIAELEARTVAALSKAVESLPRPPFQYGSTLRTMTLSYEYQAFLSTFRRTFEYLSRGIAGAFGLEPPYYSRDLADTLKAADPRYLAWVAPMRRQLAATAARFTAALAEDSPRNRTAHKRPVGAGDMRLWLEPGAEPRVGLEQGGEGVCPDFG